MEHKEMIRGTEEGRWWEEDEGYRPKMSCIRLQKVLYQPLE